MSVGARSSISVRVAYDHCERITRARAGNFSWGIRLLPSDRRRGLSAVYALSRRIDDIGDGSLSRGRKTRELERVRDDLATLSVKSPDAVLVAVADARHRFDLPMDAFDDLVEGVLMDVRGTDYETFADLEVYCRRVAGSVGRLSVAVFGSDRPDVAGRLGDDLGVAMQLTNVLRDVGEDLATGRVYLPAEDRARFGCLDLAAATDRELGALVRFEIDRARTWFARGLRLLPLLDARAAACVGAMSGIYRRLLDRLERRPEDARRRVSLPGWEKALVAARSLIGGLGRAPDPSLEVIP